MEDGDCFGVSLGEADIELDEDDGEDSMVAVRRRGLRAVTVDAIAARSLPASWRQYVAHRMQAGGQLMLRLRVRRSTIDDYSPSPTKR